MTNSPTNNKSFLARLRSECATYRAHHALAPLSVTGYASDWRLFSRWCIEHGIKSLPAKSETLSLYAADMLARGKKITTARRNLQGIVEHHRLKGMDLPSAEDARAVLSGAQRMAPQDLRQMEPLSLSNIERICGACDPKSRRDARDRAILVTGFASALRISNLSALDLADVEFTAKGIVLHIRKEKQDRLSKGRLIGLPSGQRAITCPVACLRAWLSHRGMSDGPLFTRMEGEGVRLRAPSITEVLKLRIEAIGLDASLYAGHSMRAGFVTEAGERGVSDLIIASQTGHKSMKVLRRYFRRRDLWKANAAGMIGL
jgi:site-specific recombinase XerD